MKSIRFITTLAVCAIIMTVLVIPNQVRAASAADLDREAMNALKKLYSKSPSAKVLGQKAKAILVFPSVKKAGFIVGGQFGEGVLFRGGKAAGYYSTVAASYGLQAGIQKFGYAMFFMTEEKAKYLERSDGWELGSAPSIVIADKGAAGGISTTTARSDIYAFFFSQKGLMAGLGLQGTKITKIEK
jgi:lipid-binding SYLF domain-containing protein